MSKMTTNNNMMGKMDKIIKRQQEDYKKDQDSELPI